MLPLLEDQITVMYMIQLMWYNFSLK